MPDQGKAREKTTQQKRKILTAAFLVVGNQERFAKGP